MKKNGMILLCLVLSMGWTSCSDNKKEEEPEVPEYPKTLTLKEVKIGEFKIHVGSDEGAIEIPTTGFTPEYFWGDRLEYAPTALRIENEEKMSRIPTDTDSDTFLYEIREDSLFRFNDPNEKWYWSAKVEEGGLVYHIGYHYAKRRNEMGQTFGIGQWNEWFEPEKQWYEWPETLTYKTDTTAWCNMLYIFEYDE